MAQTEFVVFPRGADLAPTFGESAVDLGGLFYDHWITAEGRVAGIRYYRFGAIDPRDHPVFAQFIGDERFVFGRGWVDLVFDERDAQSLRNDALSLDVVQDFGADRVVESGTHFGIAITLDRPEVA